MVIRVHRKLRVNVVYGLVNVVNHQFKSTAIFYKHFQISCSKIEDHNNYCWVKKISLLKHAIQRRENIIDVYAYMNNMLLLEIEQTQKCRCRPAGYTLIIFVKNILSLQQAFYTGSSKLTRNNNLLTQRFDNKTSSSSQFSVKFVKYVSYTMKI